MRPYALNKKERSVKKKQRRHCVRCSAHVEDYWTVQSYQGEPFRESIAELDCPICATCYVLLGRWLNCPVDKTPNP